MTSRYLLAILCSLSLLHCSNDEQSLGGNVANNGAGQSGTGNTGAGQAGVGQAGAGQGGAGAGQAGQGGTDNGGAGNGQTVGPPLSDKVDIVFMIDNSASMADKQKILKDAVPDLINRLIQPQCVTKDASGVATPLPRDQQPSYGDSCPSGSIHEFAPITDIHIGVVTSSLGSHGGDGCPDVNEDASGQAPSKNFTKNDHGHLITRGPRSDANVVGSVVAFPQATTYNSEGFLAWDPTGTKNTPAGETDPVALKKNFQDIVIGADQVGCGFESQLEGWYRFLVDPNPPGSVTVPPTAASAQTIEDLYASGPAVVSGTDDVLLQQRADFLRPDSLVSVIMLTDENDCSIIDGALTADVCDKPVLGSDGKPTGECQEARKGWPAGYGVEGNMQGFTKDADGRVTGAPFALNYLIPSQNLVPSLFPGTAACATDPTSSDCQSCYFGANEHKDECKTRLDPKTADPVAQRCWEPRRRFGVDPFYPLGRYVNGLTQAKVYDREGNLVDNPLFADLPYLAAQAAGTPLGRPQAPPRSPKLVYLTGIVGVPWQDIARDPTDLSKGYLPGVPGNGDTASINWERLAGDPSVRDPLLIETTQVRSGKNILGEDINQTSWNHISGHEWTTGVDDLQYACIFDLPTPIMDGVDCVIADNNPLCEAPSASDPSKGDGKATTTQYRAKAYPGLRYFPVLEQLKDNGILTSICTPNTTDSTRDDYGYRTSVNGIVDRVKPRLLQ